jgi:hypothetical protein
MSELQALLAQSRIMVTRKTKCNDEPNSNVATELSFLSCAQMPGAGTHRLHERTLLGQWDNHSLINIRRSSNSSSNATSGGAQIESWPHQFIN